MPCERLIRNSSGDCNSPGETRLNSSSSLEIQLGPKSLRPGERLIVAPRSRLNDQIRLSTYMFVRLGEYSKAMLFPSGDQATPVNQCSSGGNLVSGRTPPV